MLSHHAAQTAGLNFALSLSRGLRHDSDLRLCTFLPMIYHIGDEIFPFGAFVAGGELGQPVGGGQAGEAVYRSPIMTAGYYRDLEATRQAFRGGWFHSGDSVAVDEDGLRIMLDRYKDIVKTGGENVSSLRVEAVLYQHLDVLRAAVIGLPHEHWGEAVTAIVVPREGATPEADELIAHCRAQLAGYETPKAVVFAGQLPKTVGGKILKYKLRTEYTGLYTA